MSYLEFDILIKLGISAVLGMVIGLERELKRKPVGLKTSLVISIVSCLLTIVSIESAYKFPHNDLINITMDPLRLAAQIVSGIGFLGAGVILRRENDSISGLTTAALIWGAAGVGIAVGAGYYVEAIAGVTMLIISVKLIPFLFSVIGPKQLRQKEIPLQLRVSDKENFDSILLAFEKEKITIRSLHIKDLKEGDHLIRLIVTVDYKRNITDVYYSVSRIEGVKRMEIGSLQ
ncbi:MgtC/SapB family protein [Bacillus sp. V3B]|uniref:MgtC/SapB family protein n=1 Tax=Bacillus sp. V3B TaxID=2804915 RepID=UPI00210E53F4|nr:MgtC/SapB family protein [Bacillus sp. V3B]MCQ6277296.1 MgtC/SapB family protein [Bacillus sp. V3B]